MPLVPLKWIASLDARGGVKSGRLKTVELPSTVLWGVVDTAVPDSEIELPCSVPFAVAGLPLTDVQSAKSLADWAWAGDVIAAKRTTKRMWVRIGMPRA